MAADAVLRTLSVGARHVKGRRYYSVLDAAREALDALNQVREREGAATAAEILQRSQAVTRLVEGLNPLRRLGTQIPAFLYEIDGRVKRIDLLQR